MDTNDAPPPDFETVARDAARTPADTLRQLCNGQIHAADLSPSRAAEVIRYARKQVAGRQRLIRERLNAGRRGIAIREARRLLISPCNRLAAAAEAVNRPSRNFGQAWRLAEAAKAHGPGRAVIYPKRKLDGGYRPIFVFQPAMTVRHLAVRAVLQPLAGLHSSGYLPSGGRTEACQILKAIMADAEGDFLFVQLDVRQYFRSISHRYLENTLPLPKAVIREVVHTGLLHLNERRGWQARYSREEIEDLNRCGIPQGSALSSLVADMVMADVLNSLSVGLNEARLVTYCDNLAIVVRPERFNELIGALRVGFMTHPAGGFSLHVPRPRPVTSRCRFLGYDFRKTRDGVLIEVDDETFAQRDAVHQADIANATTFGRQRQAIQRAMGYCAAFHLDATAQARHTHYKALHTAFRQEHGDG